MLSGRNIAMTLMWRTFNPRIGTEDVEHDVTKLEEKHIFHQAALENYQYWQVPLATDKGCAHWLKSTRLGAYEDGIEGRIGLTGEKLQIS